MQSCTHIFIIGHWEQIEAGGDFLESSKDKTMARGRTNTASFIKSKLVSETIPINVQRYITFIHGTASKI